MPFNINTISDITDILMIGLVVVDKDKKIISINKYIECLTGFKISKLIGQFVDLLITTPIEIDKHLALGMGNEASIVCVDGVSKAVEIGLSPYKNTTLTLIIEIEDRKAREAMADESKIRRKKVDEAKSIIEILSKQFMIERAE